MAGRSRKLPIPVLVAIIGVVGTIIVALIKLLSVGSPTATPTTAVSIATAPPVVKITSLSDLDIVSTRVDSVFGIHDHVPNAKQVWLVVSGGGSSCFPQDGPALLQDTGNWRHGPINFPSTGRFQLSTVLADANMAALLRTAVGSKSGMPCTNIAEVIETISVEVVAAPGGTQTVEPSSSLGTMPPQTAVVKITSLSPGQEVGAEVPLVNGTHSAFPADRELWLVIFVGANYFPQNGPAVLLPNGTWNHGTIHFGSTGEFVVYAVSVDAPSSLVFRQAVTTLQALPELPKGVDVLDAVSVIRKQ